MQEGDSLSFSANAGCFVDKPKTGVTAFLEHAVEVVHGETDVMDTRPSFCDVFPDRRIVGLRFEQLYQGFTGSETDNGGAVGIPQGNLGHFQHIAQDRQQLVDGAHSHPDVGDARAAANGFGHTESVRAFWGITR